MKHLMLASAAIVLAACSAETDPETIETTETTPMEMEMAGAPEVQTSTPTDPMTQTFVVMNSAGAEIGDVTITDQPSGGVMLTLNVSSIPEGDHAIHFHQLGQCDTPDFTSSGGHYNPTDSNHGFEADAPNPHAGDMPNFTAPLSGLVKTDILNERVSLSVRDGYAPLFDADNTALIIHAGSDDYITQPTGAAGGRIACAVIAP